jgi:predicted NUDIX family NTP pyrophosphohydrolase
LIFLPRIFLQSAYDRCKAVAEFTYWAVASSEKCFLLSPNSPEFGALATAEGPRHHDRAGELSLPHRAGDVYPAEIVAGAVRFSMENQAPMPRVSAGLLMYRILDGKLQVLLAHPGGPFFKNKDEGAWSIPKGEIEPGEDLLDAAKREFAEETGVIPSGPFVALTPVTQKGGKIVHAWAFKGDCDPSAIVSNTFTMEWPPRSGRQMEFPEIDRADFFDVAAARRKIKSAQVPLIDEVERIVNGEG